MLQVAEPAAPRPLLWLAFAAGAGVALAVWISFPPLLFLLLFLISSVAVVVAKEGAAANFLPVAVVSAFALYAQSRLDFFVPEHVLCRLQGVESAQVRLQVLVVEEPERRGRGLDFPAEIRGMELGGRPEICRGKIRVLLQNVPERLPEYGDVLDISGLLRRTAPPRNPGEFDYRHYLAVHGVYYECRVETMQVLETGRSWWWYKAAVKLRKSMLHTLGLGLEKDAQITGLMAAMLFGDTDGIESGVVEAFRNTGTIHLFAVSGQNVAEVLYILLLFLELSGAVKWRWAWLALPFLLIFCLATGMQASAARALVMAVFVLLAWVLCRPPGVWNLLGASALVLLAWDPAELLDTGFQLSFGVVLGLAAGAGRLTRFCYAPLAPDPWIPKRLLPGWRTGLDKWAYGCCGLVAVSLCAWLSSLPLLVILFHQVSPVALLANLLVVPLAGVVVTITVLSVVSGWVWSLPAILCNEVNWLLLKVLLGIVLLLSRVPGGHFYAGWGGPAEGHVRFTWLDSRTGTAALIETPRKTWLLDTGNAKFWNASGRALLRQRGVNSLDGVILTQSTESHMGGAAAVLMDGMRVGFWAGNGFWGRAPVLRKWLDGMEKAEVPKQFWRAGDYVELGDGLAVEVLWPVRDVAPIHSEDAGLVIRFKSAGGVLLYAGDISKPVERRLIKEGVPLQADVLVQGGPAAAGNLSPEWLDAVRPCWLIRPGSGYGADCSLDAGFWEKARELNIKVLRLEETGAVCFDIGGKNCLISKQFESAR